MISDMQSPRKVVTRIFQGIFPTPAAGISREYIPNKFLNIVHNMFKCLIKLMVVDPNILCPITLQKNRSTWKFRKINLICIRYNIQLN